MEVVVLTDGWQRGIRHSFDYLNYSKSSELTARLDFRSSASYVTAYGGSTSKKNLTNNKQAFRGKIFFLLNFWSTKLFLLPIYWLVFYTHLGTNASPAPIVIWYFLQMSLSLASCLISRCISALAVLGVVVNLSLRLSPGFPLATDSVTAWLCPVCCFVTRWKEEGMTSAWWCRRSRRTTPTEGAAESSLLTQDVMTPRVLHRAKSSFFFCKCNEPNIALQLF